jgi:S-adenosylmethionine hydrolase
VTCISILTDFGLKDGNVGVMKGVIWGIAPTVQISDLSHDIPPQNTREAAFVLARAAPYFPQGTIHLVVVDPGVGTERRAIAAEIGPYKFVGPDNGVLTRLWDFAQREAWSTHVVCLDQPQYWLKDVSHVFHGRDIFAPVAAHLALGIPLQSVGTTIDQPILLSLPIPQRIGDSLHGEVIYIDRFGSLVTNVRYADLSGYGDIVVRVAGAEVRGLVKTFAERPPGTLVALSSSTGDLIVSIVNGNASQGLGSKVGDPVEVETLP